MDSLSVLAFTFAMMALGIAVFVYMRLDNLEKKLKKFDVIPKEFSSQEPEKESSSQD